MSDADKYRCSVTGGVYAPNSFSDAVHSYIAADSTGEGEALNRLFATPPALFQWFAGLLSELEIHTIEALSGQSFTPVLESFQEKWLKVAVALLNNQYPSEAKSIIQRLYQLVRTQEIERRERFHKGTILWWLARANHDLGVIDQARNHFLLAMIEDVRMDNNTWRNQPARDWLVNRLQVDASTVDQMGETVQSFLERSSWDPREPELAWLHLKPQRRRVCRSPLEFIKSVASEFLIKAQQVTPTSKEVGDRLEQLTSYLFAVESGFEVLGSTRSPDSQNDVLIRNRHEDAAIASLGDYLIVECKNWSRPVKAPTIREFAGRLRTSKVKTGVLVSKNGITGTKKKGRGTGAREAISKEYLQDSTAILVLDEAQIIDLVAGKLNLSTELIEQFEKVRFDIR